MMRPLLTFTLIAFLCACAPAPPPRPLPGGAPLQRLAALDADGVFAADPALERVALASGGLHLLDMASGSQYRLAAAAPAALAWRRDGRELAAAFPAADGGTRLVRYAADGRELATVALPATVTALAWSDRGDLLAAGYVLRRWSFGANLRQLLFRIDGDGIGEIPLSDTTLGRANAGRFADRLERMLPVAFSPAGDELVYLSLHDPPEFSPYLELLHRNWPAAAERSLLRLPLRELALTWDTDGEAVLLHAEQGSQRVALWPEAGEGAADAGYGFAYGRLYDGAVLLADWGAAAHLQRLADGRFLLAVDGALFHGEGLRPTPAGSPGEKAWSLRRWRFQGLITPEECRRALREEGR